MTLGPYFRWEPWADDAGWRPVAELQDPDVVGERVDAARLALLAMFGLAPDDVPVRVVASITFLGWASRLLSPPLGAAVTTGLLPIPDPARMWWRPAVGGPLPMAAGDLPVVPCDDLPAGRVADLLPVDSLVRPILEVFRSRFRLSPKVLWGNVTSALAGAAGVLDRPRAGAIVAAGLARPPLAGTGTLTAAGKLVRANCCLYYRIPGGGTCADCILAHRSRHPSR